MPVATEVKAPEHVEKYKKLKKKAKQMLETTKLEHRRAYITAQDKHLKTEEGLIDYELLEKPEIQEEFVKTMSEHYISKAKEALKVGKEELDEMEEALLMNAYAGVTREQLRFVIGRLGKDFTFDEYEKRHPKYMENISNAVVGAAGQHLKDEHIEDLLKDANATAFINLDYVTLEQAKMIHGLYDEIGAMSRKILEGLVKEGKLPKAALKKEEEEEKKTE